MKKRLLLMLTIVGTLIAVSSEAIRYRPYYRHLDGDTTETIIRPPKELVAFSFTRLAGTDTVSIWFKYSSTDSVKYQMFPMADVTIPVVANFPLEAGVRISPNRGIRVIKASGTLFTISGAYFQR
jgi:hypothetical protein